MFTRIFSLCHSVNGDSCDHSTFLPWNKKPTTFVSLTSVGGGGVGLNPQSKSQS